jgi:hypothetical protein
VLATAPAGAGPAAALAWEDTTVLRRLLEQLGTLGARATVVLTRPGWEADVRGLVEGLPGVRVQATESPSADLRTIAELARTAPGGLVVALGDIITHREALAGLLADPRVPTGILTQGARRPLAFRVRAYRGRVLAAGSPYHLAHRATGTFLGVLKVAAADAPALADTATRLATLTEPPLPDTWAEELDRKAESWTYNLAAAAAAEEDAAELAADDDLALTEVGPPAEGEDIELAPGDAAEVERRLAIVREDVSALLLVGLVRSDVHLGVHHLRHLFWSRALSAEAVELAAEDITQYDEDKVLLDSAVKATDGFFTTHFVSPYSKYIARWAAHRGFTPNQITSVSLGIGFLAAAAFAVGERWGLIAGAVLLQLAFTTDCVDGQLARYTRTFSKLGAWLDSMFDRTKEYLVFAGLALGAQHMGQHVWLLAGAALTLQVVRHTMDFSFGQSRQQVIARVDHPPLEATSDGPIPKRASERLAAAAAAREPEPAAASEPPPNVSLPRRFLRLWRRADRRPGVLWVKRVIAFPIGERVAAISLTAALFTPRVTFIVLLVWGGLALLYTLPGRFLRSLTR